MLQAKLPQCFLCGRIPKKGYREGIVINNCFICESCEKKIVNITNKDKYYYEVAAKLKKIWI
jgi:hypothetical protein